MSRLGLQFESISADIDETPQSCETPEQTATRLAIEKARAVRASHEHAWIIGGDQVIHRGERRFGKPETRANAVDQLLELSGRSHTLLTSVALASPAGSYSTELVRYQMQMRTLSRAEAIAYVDEDEPLNCAGSYKVESGGIRLFSNLTGDDYTAIVGLPLTRVWSLLEEAGFFEPEDEST